jgi:hypothetical protein
MLELVVGVFGCLSYGKYFRVGIAIGTSLRT